MIQCDCPRPTRTWNEQAGLSIPSFLKRWLNQEWVHLHEFRLPVTHDTDS